MRREIGQDREARHLRLFKELFSGFPTGDVKHRDAPDFRVETATGVLGIEHTEIYQQDNPARSAPLQAIEELRDSVTAQAREIYERRGGRLATVFVRFQSDLRLPKRGRFSVAEKLANLVGEARLEPGQKLSRERSWRDPAGLPKGVEAVIAYGSDVLKRSIWQPEAAGVVEMLTPERVQQLIEAKGDRVDSYRASCAEVWLLLVADGLQISTTVGLTEEALEASYRSRFDRVFLLQALQRWEVELTLECRSLIVEVEHG